MNTLSPGDRVQVVGKQYASQLSSMTGTVLTHNPLDGSLWVRMNGEVHRNLRWFPRGHQREHDIPLTADECRKVRA